MNKALVQHRRALLLAIIVGLAVLLPIINTATATGGDHVSGNRVLVIGDSILNFSQGDVSQALAADGWEPGVDGRSGSTIESWESLVGPDASIARPDIAVVELGTNDCNTACNDLSPAIDDIVEQLIAHGAGVVLWLNVQTARFPLPPGAPSVYPRHADYVNYALEQAAVRWPQMQVVDFSSFFAQQPGWHLPDGVHPNTIGQQELASLIRFAIHPWNPAQPGS